MGRISSVFFLICSSLMMTYCAGIAKLNIQKVVPIQSGYYNKLSFGSDNFWSDDSSHTITQDGEINLQLLYTYDSSQFDIFLFNQDQMMSGQYKNYESNVNNINKQRSCVEVAVVDILPEQALFKQQNFTMPLSQLDGQTLIIDNTKYPCYNGSYYPLIQMHYEYSITLNFEYSYYYAYKSVILFGVLLLLIYVSGIIIFYFRQRKQHKKILQRQLLENKMMEQKELPNEFNQSGQQMMAESDFDSNKSVVNSLASFSAGFQRNYNQKKGYMGSLQQSSQFGSKANITSNSGKSNNPFISQTSNNVDDSYNKLSRPNTIANDSRRETNSNKSVDREDKRFSDGSSYGFNESDIQSSYERFQTKQFASASVLNQKRNAQSSILKSNDYVLSGEDKNQEEIGGFTFGSKYK